MPASAPSPTTSQRAASSAPPAAVLPPAGGITCPSPQKTPTTRREILVALGEDARGSLFVSDDHHVGREGNADDVDRGRGRHAIESSGAGRRHSDRFGYRIHHGGRIERVRPFYLG